MSLANRLAQSPPVRVRRCAIGKLLIALPPSEGAALDRALNSPDWLGTDLANELRAEGHNVASNTVNRHRRKECTCDLAGDGDSA